MKFKSILSVAVFAAAFILSSALAGLFAVKTEILTIEPIFVSAAPGSDARPTQCFGHHRNTAANVSAAAKINGLLEQDDANTRARVAKIERVSPDYEPPFAAGDETLFSEYSVAVSHYADQSGAMKDDNFPTDFQSAWREYMKAWRDYADFLEEMKIPETRGVADEDNFAQFNKIYNEWIDLTWIEVLHVANNNGADTGKYVVEKR